MCKSILSRLASQWFAQYSRLAYWVARRWVRRLLHAKAIAYTASQLEELAQDAVARGYDRFVGRCQRDVCGASQRRKWVCQCVIKGAFDAIRRKSTFGSVSSGAAIRDDAMNRLARVRPGFVHGDDDERRDALEQTHYRPVAFPVQQWELEQLAERELPPRLRQTAVYAAIGLSQEQSAILQRLSARTVRLHLQELREHLSPPVNAYAVVYDAVRACLSPSAGAAVDRARGDFRFSAARAK